VRRWSLRPVLALSDQSAAAWLTYPRASGPRASDRGPRFFREWQAHVRTGAVPEPAVPPRDRRNSQDLSMRSRRKGDLSHLCARAWSPLERIRVARAMLTASADSRPAAAKAAEPRTGTRERQ